MDAATNRKVLVEQYRSYSDILNQKGIVFNGFTEKEVESLNDTDLQRLIRIARDLGRTPTG